MNGATGQRALPDGWQCERLGDIGTWVGGGTPSKQRPEYWTGGTLPWLSPKDMKATVLEATQDRITEEAVEGSAAKRFPANCIAIVVRSGILEHTLPVALIPFEAAANQDMRIVEPAADIHAEWLLYCLLGHAETIRRSCSKDGTTVASIDVPRMMEYEVLVPPPDEQERILGSVAAYLGVLAVGVEAVDDASRRLRPLRESILQTAVAAGEAGTVGELLIEIEAGKSFRCHGYAAAPDKWGVLKVSAMTWGAFREEENKEVFDDSKVNPAWEVRPGDLLISRANTSEYVGAAVYVDSTRPRLLLSDKSLRLVCDPDRALPEWLFYALNAPSSRAQMSATATGTSDSMRNLSQDKIKAVQLLTPSVDEQQSLIEAIRVQLAGVETLRAGLDEAFANANRLRTAVLRDAAEGRLPIIDERDPVAA